MLTHMHKVEHLVVSTFEQRLKRWREFGFLGIRRFRENKMYFFYFAGGKFAEVAGVPDAGRGDIGR